MPARMETPEALVEAGCVFTIPQRCTSIAAAVPSPREVAPIARLWDDPPFAARHGDRARVEARRWDGERVAGSSRAVGERPWIRSCRQRARCWPR
jgi:hypothetical protein